MNYTIKNGKYALTVSDMGAEPISLKLGDRELLWQNTGDFWSKHAPVLFPLCGRLPEGKYTLGDVTYEMKCHGFAASTKFELTEQTDCKLKFAIQDTEETRAQFPFEFRLEAEYSLTGDTVSIYYTLCNRSDKEMPYMFGWHPGFSYPDSVSVLEDIVFDFGDLEELTLFPLREDFSVDSVGHAVPAKGGIYKAETDFLYKTDTIILGRHNNALSLYTKENDLRFDFSWSENLPSLCIWKEPDDTARFICIEPWTSLPGIGENFDTRDMRRLPAGECETFTYNLKFTN